MMNVLGPPVRDLVEWVAKEPRPYADVMEAWRTSCPRLTVWEDAIDRGFVRRESRAEQGMFVVVTSEGLEFLRTSDRSHGDSITSTRRVKRGEPPAVESRSS